MHPWQAKLSVFNLGDAEYMEFSLLVDLFDLAMDPAAKGLYLQIPMSKNHNVADQLGKPANAPVAMVF